MRFWFLAFALLSLIHSSPLPCTTVTAVVHDHFLKFINLQRRGAPTTFLMPFFSSYITSLDHYVAGLYPYEKALGPVCLTNSELDNFKAFENASLVYGEIDKLHEVDPELFYLPPSMVSDSQLMSLTHDEQSLVDGVWDFTLEALENPPSSIVDLVRSVLPPGLKILYDPESQTVCERFLAFKQSIPENKLVTSNYFIADVVATVIRAHMLGVPDNYSLSILHHAVAFVFNGIRCERLQNEQLKVSLVYLSFYNEAFRIYTASKDLSEVPQIPVSLVQELLSDDIRILSSFHSWGRLEHIFYDGSVMKKVHISDKIFATEILSEITDSLSIPLPSPEASETSSTHGISLHPAYRSVYTCAEAYFAYPSTPATSMSECCADICLDPALYQSVGITSTSECCGYCNEESCPLDSSNPLSQLAPIHLEPYGYVPPTTTPIDI